MRMNISQGAETRTYGSSIVADWSADINVFRLRLKLPCWQPINSPSLRTRTAKQDCPCFCAPGNVICQGLRRWTRVICQSTAVLYSALQFDCMHPCVLIIYTWGSFPMNIYCMKLHERNLNTETNEGSRTLDMHRGIETNTKMNLRRNDSYDVLNASVR